MAQKSAIVEKLLSRVSSQLVPDGYISEMLLPNIPVAQDSGKLAKYGNQHLRIVNTLMGGISKARRIVSNIRTQSSFQLEKHGLEELVTEEDKANFDAPYMAMQDAVIGLTSLLWTAKEFALASTLADTAVLTQNTTLVGPSQFSDYANSDPIGVVKTAKFAIRDGCGMPPNTMWCDWVVAEHLRYHPQILESLGYKDNRPGGLSNMELASAFQIDKFLVAKPIYNSAVEGQSDSLGAIWGKHLWLGYIPDAPRPRQVALGYHVMRSGQGPRRVFIKDVDNPPEADSVIVIDKYDQFLSNVSAAYLIKDAVA